MSCRICVDLVWKEANNRSFDICCPLAVSWQNVYASLPLECGLHLFLARSHLLIINVVFFLRSFFFFFFIKVQTAMHSLDARQTIHNALVYVVYQDRGWYFFQSYLMCYFLTLFKWTWTSEDKARRNNLSASVPWCFLMWFCNFTVKA